MSEARDPPAAGRPWSLQRRLRARLLGALVVLWLAGAALALLGMRHETAEVLDSALEEMAQRLLVLPADALGDDRDPGGVLAAEIGEHEEKVVYQVFDASGRMRLRSHHAPTEPMTRATRDGFIDANGWHLYALTRDDGARRALVAESWEHRAEMVAKFSGWLVGPLLALLPLAALAIHLMLRAAFRSLESARVALAEREPQDLRPVPVAGAPRELQPLLETVNALLGRVGALVESERLFAARSAHELRTPIAAARAQAQRLAAESTEPAARERAQRLVAQLDRLTALAARLLQLARIESGVALAREPVALAMLARLVVDEFAAERDSGRLRLEIAPEAGEVRGDVDALAIALRNLIDNALKHAGPAATVRVRAAPQRLAVSDDGPGIAPETIARLKRPFERGAQVLAEGAGLGLSMVETIARQSGARFELRSPGEGGRGVEAVLDFGAEPAATAAASPAR